MKLSVALCTYNGAAYLYEQLASIAAQSRLPDELVICDDASTDGTRDIIQSFAAQAPFAVRSHFNPKNLGSTKNFEQAIARCEGDIIALSDQDDVWQPHKLERLEAAFAPGIGLVCSDAELVDENLVPLGSRLWQKGHFRGRTERLVKTGRTFEALFTRNFVTGATMAFRSEFKHLILPIPEGPLIHDAWIALLIAAVADIAFIREPLILYRQHSQQQVGASAPATPQVLSRQHYAGQIEQLNVLAERLRGLRWLAPGDSPLHADAALIVSRIPAKIAHIQARLDLPASQWRRLPGVLRELLTLRYHRHSHGWRSAARDLLF